MPHINEKIDFTVEVYIVFKNKVLLRKHDKYKLWLSVGGHIELYEDPNEAAVREVKEEVGLDVKLYIDDSYHMTLSEKFSELIRPQFLNRHRINDSHEHICLVYFARANTDKLIFSDVEKSGGCKWFFRNELNDPKYGVNDVVKMYANCALDKLSEN
ncbi:NUDIX domain-containing protein [Candidatus Woesearchaeota archaeon]|nr:NUDIX domain-containing protein [Candidatus Woesearchaeota archaeon]MCF8014050.1 NUDIX domain-containing protein [Candidatus Woesearchaeota archaeon]